VIQKRKAKQRKVDEALPLSRNGYWGAGKGDGKNHPERGSKLIFKKGTAAIAGAWQPGSPLDPPEAPEAQP